MTNQQRATPCQNIIQDIYDIMTQINQYLCMKRSSSTIDIFFYIERSIRAKALCEQIKDGELPVHFQEELQTIYKGVKDRWQHDFQLIAMPPSMHSYLKDDGRVSLNQNKIVL